MQNRQFLLTQFSVAQADLERTLPAALLRLLEYFPKHEESIFKLFLGLDQDSTRLFACANEIGYLDHFADNDAIFDITDGCGLDTLPNSVGSKTDFLQFAGKYGLEARAMRCEIAVLKLLDSAIDDPSVLSDRLDESLLDCGISWQGDSPVRLVDDLGAKQ